MKSWWAGSGGMATFEWTDPPVCRKWKQTLSHDDSELSCQYVEPRTASHRLSSEPFQDIGNKTFKRYRQDIV